MMKLIPLSTELSVCKIQHPSAADWHGAFTALVSAGQELSLVCESRAAPADALAVEPGWRAFRIAGSLDFSMVGVLADISGALAAAGISIFAVSTYDTDYVLMKAANFSRGLAELQKKGYAVLAT